MTRLVFKQVPAKVDPNLKQRTPNFAPFLNGPTYFFRLILSFSWIFGLASEFETSSPKSDNVFSIFLLNHLAFIKAKLWSSYLIPIVHASK